MANPVFRQTKAEVSEQESMVGDQTGCVAPQRQKDRIDPGLNSPI
jgi:hypothetical protein